MNYQRVKQQAALKALIKKRLMEKSEALKSLKGQSRYDAEKMIIEEAKKEFKLGYKNSKQKSGKEDDQKNEGNEANSQGQGSEGSEGQGSNEGQQGSSEGGSEFDGSDESNEGSDENSNEESDGSKPGNEKPLEEMDEQELKAYAEKHEIDLGNASSKNGFLKKIQNHLEGK